MFEFKENKTFAFITTTYFIFPDEGTNFIFQSIKSGLESTGDWDKNGNKYIWSAFSIAAKMVLNKTKNVIFALKSEVRESTGMSQMKTSLSDKVLKDPTTGLYVNDVTN